MKKKLFTILLSVSLLFSLTGCAKEEPAKEPVKEVQTQENTETEETRTFTDSVGRTVTIPKELKKIAPSGPVAQLVLYTAAPDLLCGLAREFPETAKGYIDDSYYSLPVFGQFYGKNANLNMEALLAASPELVIDIGEPKENIGEELDSLSEQLVFLLSLLKPLCLPWKALIQSWANYWAIQKNVKSLQNIARNF